MLSLAPELEDYKMEIATALLEQCNHIHTVLNKTSRLEGERRVARLEVLAGVRSTITTHKEFGFIYHLDVARVFFNSRLGSERMRWPPRSRRVKMCWFHSRAQVPSLCRLRPGALA